MICLYWLNKPLEKLAVYVHNRIKSIRDTGFHEQVFFTGSEENVADLVTKVKTPSAFIDNEFWNQGPAYLKEESWATGRSINEIHEKHKLSAGQNDEIEKETKKEVKMVNLTTIIRNELTHNMVCEVVLRSNNLNRIVWILRNCIKAVLIFKREFERIKLVKEGASADKNKISTEKSEVHNDDTTPAIMNEVQN